MTTVSLGKLYHGDVLDILPLLQDESINMVMTSPPYWNLRDYGVEGQLGNEQTFDEYIEKLCKIFCIIKDKLREEGTCFVNIGDTYAGNKDGKTDEKKAKYLKMKENEQNIKKRIGDYIEKCLCCIPDRFKIGMINHGWICRNEIIWHKPNAMPESVKDRFTVDFEKLFFFTKNRKYFFKQQFERHMTKPRKKTIPKWHNIGKTSTKEWTKDRAYGESGKNLRSVWSIMTMPTFFEHAATYPEKLCKIPIMAGCPKDGIVLDPFLGSGTTALVCEQLGYKWIGIDLSERYCENAVKRISNEANQIKMF